MPALITKSGEMWEPPADKMEFWKQAYPKVDIDGELLQMQSWLQCNESKRKTSRGMARFCNSWLSRAQANGGQGLAKPKKDRISTRDMSLEDELTDVSWLDPETAERMKVYFLAKRGQYFDGERVEG